MTRVGRKEGHMGVARGRWVKVKARGPLSGTAQTLGAQTPTDLSKLEANVSRTGQYSIIQAPGKRVISPWPLSIDTARLAECNGKLLPRLNHFRLNKFEPRQAVPGNTTTPVVPRRLPSLRGTFRRADQASSNRDPASPEIDIGFDGPVQDVFSQIDSISKTPLFQQLDKPGLYDEKLTKSPKITRIMEETDKKADETNKQILHYIREREAALDEVKKIKAELTETQSKLYDAMKLTEELEKKVQSDNKKSKNTKKAPPPKKKANPSPTKPPPKNATNGSGDGTTGVGADGLYHPPVDQIDSSANSREYYCKLAESFPTLPMMHVIDAEKKFMDADADNSGYIDKDELDRVLCNTVGLFTPKQVEEIFNEVDTNHSESVDFYEVLVILNKLHSKRRTNLPQSVQQNYSKTCSIQ